MRSDQFNYDPSDKFGNQKENADTTSESNNDELYLRLGNLLKERSTITKYEMIAAKLYTETIGDEIARPYTPADVVAIIFYKLCKNSYHWNYEKYTFDTFMYYRIKTILSKILEREQNFLPVDIDLLITESEYDFDEDECKTNIKTEKEFIEEPNFIDVEDKDEQEFDLTDLMEVAYKLFENYTIELCVLDEIIKGKRPKEIASYLGISRQEARNTVMRIRRILLAWCTKHKHEELLKLLLSPVKKNNRKNNCHGNRNKD